MIHVVHTCCNTLQHTATHCNTLQHSRRNVTIERDTPGWVMSYTLQHAATHCNTLPHSATHCNTGWAMSYTRASQVARMNELYHTCEWHMWHDTFHWNCYTPKIHQIQKLRFLGISRYKFKLRFGCNLNVHRAIRISRLGGFRRCGNFSGNCHINEAIFCYGYCATWQGSLDWREVHLSARPTSWIKVICVLCFLNSYKLSSMRQVSYCIYIYVKISKTLEHVTKCNTVFDTLQHATYCNKMRHTATYFHTLHHAGIHCNTLQHTATRCREWGVIYESLQHIHVYTGIHVHTRTHAHTHTHTHTHTPQKTETKRFSHTLTLPIYVYIYIHTYNIHMYIYIRTHTHTHIYIYIYI